MAHVRQGIAVTNHLSLASLGWQPFFQQQLSLQEWDVAQPARITEQHKSEIELATETGTHTLAITYSMPPLTVGDWVLLDGDGLFARALQRQSCFRHQVAGNKVSEQPLAARKDPRLKRRVAFLANVKN